MTATIKKHKNKWQILFVFDNDYDTFSLWYPTYEEAVERLDNVKQEVAIKGYYEF